MFLSAGNIRSTAFLLFLCGSLLLVPLHGITSIYADDGQGEGISPLAPQNLRVVEDSITHNQVTLAWDPVDNNPYTNDEVQVYRLDGDTPVWQTYMNVWNPYLTNLSPETTYRILIVWDGDAALEYKSDIIEFTTLEEDTGGTEPDPELVKAAPPNLRIVPDTLAHDSVQLLWDSVENSFFDTNEIQIYHADIYYDDDNPSDGYFKYMNIWHNTLTGLTPETTYRLFIVWEQDKAIEYRSEILEFTTTEDLSLYENPPLSPPHQLRITGLSDSGVALGWTESPGADSYDLYVNGSIIANVSGDDSYLFALPEQHEDGDDYRFEAVAKDSVNERESARSNAVTIVWGELAAPQDVQVVTANRTSVSLGWAPSPGATVYHIYRDGLKIGSSQTNRYVAEGLTAGQTYSFTVVAANSLWESEASEEAVAVPGSQYINFTYYTSWSIYESGRNFKPSDIDLSQITHINYAFADLCWQKARSNGNACQADDIPLQNRYVHNGEIVIGDTEVDTDNLHKFAELREEHPQLKVMISVGGWSWSDNFSNMAADEITRRAFADSAVRFLREYELDGIDIDWEYPVEGGEEDNSKRPEDKENFTLLMKTVREALDAAGSEDGRYYLLTIASGQGDNFVVNADLANSVHYLDFINIMTYDYGGSWEALANHNAPLFYDPANPKTSAPRSHVSGGAIGHLNGGVPNYKLTLGIPFYGKGWSGCPEGGQYQVCADIPAGTWERGSFDFADLEDNYVGQNGFVRYWNDAAKVAYLWSEETGIFISYNDKTTMMYSASLIKSLDLAGMMSWEISGDRNRTLMTQLVQDLPIDGVVNEDALKAPANPALTARRTTELQIKWDAAFGADDYEIYIDNRYIGATADTAYVIQSLAPSTAYSLHVLAVRKDGGEVSEVSPASLALHARTAAVPVPPIINSPPAPESNEFGSNVTVDGGIWIVSVNEADALQTIASSEESSFVIRVADQAERISVSVPKAVMSAIADKGGEGKLSVVWNGVTYTVPIQPLNLSADIRITIAPPDSGTAEAIEQLAAETGVRLIAAPLDFVIEYLNEDNEYEEITAFEGYTLSRIYELDGDGIDADKAVGVIYLPDSHEFRPVPSLFTKQGDGTTLVELKRSGNSIYAIALSSGFPFEEAVPDWARPDVERAYAKLLLPAESDSRFGAGSAITRAELVSAIVRGLGIVPDGTESPFADIDSEAPYAADVAAAYRIGLIQGKSADRFDPDGAITRQEMAVVLANALRYAELSSSQAKESTLLRYRDQDRIAPYARASAALLAEEGIMVGIGQEQYAPTMTVTRAQAAVAVMRTLAILGLVQR